MTRSVAAPICVPGDGHTNGLSGKGGKTLAAGAGASRRPGPASKTAMRLSGRTALITGAASGIGQATAVLFAKEGARVAAVDVDVPGGEETVRTILDAGGDARFVEADVSVADDARRAAETAASWMGRVDILFNNAGISHVGVLHEVPEEEWDRVVAVNLRGVYLMAKYVLPSMIAQAGGCIINMSSGAALLGLERRAVYSATKGAVLALTRAMAVDYAEYHIRVNALCPGTVYTPFVERYLRTSYVDPAAALEKIKRRQLTDTLGRPEEIAAAALYLASDDASFITGAPLIIDGGMTGGRRA
jgi:NAD(P)-dependent dehydrogenase (short-subunit alcohol dehydrogenase family)